MTHVKTGEKNKPRINKMRHGYISFLGKALGLRLNYAKTGQ